MLQEKRKKKGGEKVKVKTAVSLLNPPALNHDFVKKKKDFFAIVISELCQIHAESETGFFSL